MKGLLKVELGGEERGLLFGIGAVAEYCKMVGKDELEAIDLMLTSNPRRVDALTCMVYAAMVNYCAFEEVPVEFNKAKVQHWIGEADQKIVPNIISELLKSVGVDIPKEEKEVKKVPARKKKSPAKS